MTVKTVFILGLAYLLLSCGQQTESTENQSAKPAIDTAVAPTTAGETISPYQQELNEALHDPAIDDYYKDIYRQEKLISADDDKMLSITDSLLTNDQDKDLFYFIVFTKSMNGADGFYSEALGLAAFNFVTHKTEWFADYFNVAPKLTDQDMGNWANYIIGEIQISNENQELKAIKELEENLLYDIKGARKEYRVVIEKLMEKVKSPMPR